MEIGMNSLIWKLLAVIIYGGLAAILIWGWIRWVRNSEPRSFFSICSLISFIFGTSSLFMAVGMVLYARSIGGFDFYDPFLMKIYAWGLLISLIGLIFAAIGVWRKNLLRFHSIALSVGMLAYWMIQVSLE